ncbi:MAG TPA: shikimate dehydrogenase [Hypericibacter adhaerens]|uniref:shikimate dehydrogenase n=1 Tax=Hypericibacter adhaerens TaxID=2602016 RepID=UPI002C2C58E2|nr:shikimate dehydrogenase [Hypericibacter adhaerens]HWA41987.1 shikimate dehydrogenase [Hypericibacter adhaerens]
MTSAAPNPALTGRARLAGVMGWPVGHSLSPRLHGYWLAEHGIDGAYVPLPVPPDQFERALKALPALGFRGANVTLPHKEKALALADSATPEARRIGAANTLVIDGQGRIEARNADAFGFIESLREGAPAWRAKERPAVVIGAGGASRAILVALADAGVPEIRLINRTAARAETIAADLGGPVKVMGWADRGRALAEAGLLVNATTQGMAGHPPLDLALDRLPPDAVVHDIVYVPLETPLLAAARRRGNPVVEGLGMLLHQARLGFAAWFGVEPKVTAALRAYVLAQP